MHRPSHLPGAGEVFLDARGGARTLRVSWHREAGLVVLSLWRDGTCAGTFRLPLEEVPDLVAVLRSVLSEAYDAARQEVAADHAADARAAQVSSSTEVTTSTSRPARPRPTAT